MQLPRGMHAARHARSEACAQRLLHEPLCSLHAPSSSRVPLSTPEYPSVPSGASSATMVAAHRWLHQSVACRAMHCRSHYPSRRTWRVHAHAARTPRSFVPPSLDDPKTASRAFHFAFHFWNPVRFGRRRKPWPGWRPKRRRPPAGGRPPPRPPPPPPSARPGGASFATPCAAVQLCLIGPGRSPCGAHCGELQCHVVQST